MNVEGALRKVMAEETEVETEVEGYKLPELLVMVDCEMTGVVPGKDKLLQVAAIKLRREGNQYIIEEGDPFVRYLPHDGKPEGEFQVRYLTPVFKECNKSKLKAEQLKEDLHEWLGPEYLGKAVPVGDCVPTDIEFLRRSDCIDTPYYDKEEAIPGTFHYEYFDMNAPKQMARVKLGSKFETPNLDPGIHDALVDCENQLKELNHILRILLDGEE